MQALSPACQFDTHARAMRLLNDAKVPYVVAGAYAMYEYTGIWRFTKDLDLFLEPKDVQRALDLLGQAGYETKFEAKHWLAKAILGDCWVDLIYGFGNWMAPIDGLWFERARPATVLDVPTRIAPIEDVLWMKSYVAHWERFDLADVTHLIHSSKGKLDWPHLIARYGDFFEVLLYYLTMFTFIYPSDKNFIPKWVMTQLLGRLEERGKQPPPEGRICRGGLLDRYQYLDDFEKHGYFDVRESYAVHQNLTREDVEKDRWLAKKLVKAGRVKAKPLA